MNSQFKNQKSVRRLENKLNLLIKSNNVSKKSKKKRKGRGKKGIIMDSFRNDPNIPALTMMLRDPCNAPLAPGLHGSSQGMLARTVLLRSADSGFSALTNLYVVWFPSFHNAKYNDPASNDGKRVNIFMWASNSQATGPSLTNFGNVADATTTTAHSIDDPAWSLIAQGSAVDARTLSACIRVQYLGTTSGCKGSFVPLHNIPVEALLRNNDTAQTPASINDLQRYATQRGTRVTDCKEVIFCPDPSSAIFRDATTGPFVVDAGFNTSMSSVSRADEVNGFGFVLTNVSAASDYQIDLVKNVEWRADLGVGFTAVPRRGTDDPSVLHRVVDILDKSKPGWQDPVMNMASNFLSDVVLAGSNMMGNYMRGGSVRRSITNY